MRGGVGEVVLGNMGAAVKLAGVSVGHTLFAASSPAAMRRTLTHTRTICAQLTRTLLGRVHAFAPAACACLLGL